MIVVQQKHKNCHGVNISRCKITREKLGDISNNIYFMLSDTSNQSQSQFSRECKTNVTYRHLPTSSRLGAFGQEAIDCYPVKYVFGLIRNSCRVPLLPA